MPVIIFDKNKENEEFQKLSNELNNLLDQPNFSEPLLGSWLEEKIKPNKFLKKIEDSAKEFFDFRQRAKIVDISKITDEEQKDLINDDKLLNNFIKQIYPLDQLEPVDKINFTSVLLIWILIFINSLCFACTGAITGVYNTMLNHLSIIYKWGEGSEEDFYMGFVNSIVNISACAACIILPFLKNFGIRKLLIISLVIQVVGNILCVFETTQILLIGRALQGFCIATQQSLGVKHVMNLAPTEYKNSASIILGIYFRVGLLSVFVLGSGLPDEQDVNDNEYWRFQTLFPALYSIIYFVSLVFIFRFDSADIYYILNKNDKIKQKNQTMNVLNKVYQPERAEKEFKAFKDIYDQDEIEEPKMQDNSQGFKKMNRREKNQKITLWSLYTGAFKKAMWLCSIMVIFFQLPSTVICIVFSSFIIKEADESEAIASNFTIISSLIDLAALFIGLYISQKIGKKPQMLIGGLLSIIVTFLFAICFSSSDLYGGVKYLVLVQRLVFSAGYDSLFWGYFAEILPELGCSIIIFLFQFMQFLISQFFIQIFNGLGSETFYIFGGISIILYIYIFFFMVETKGLPRSLTIRSFMDQQQ